MFLSVFDVFKIGIGPSSSHTVGPMVAARRFLDLAAEASLPRTGRLTVTLHGSLAFTGKGHGTDRAVILGLAGENPQTMDPDRVEDVLRRMAERGAVTISEDHAVAFNPARDVIFDFGPALKGHANGMVFRILDDDNNTLLSETYFSVGGGFVQTETERAAARRPTGSREALVDVPYPFRTAAEMLEMGRRSGLTVAGMKRANERVTQGADELDANLDHIWAAMRDCMNRGLRQTGTLPGGLKVKRRAAEIHAKLKKRAGQQRHPAAPADGLALGLCDGGERGECRRRQGGHRAHQWRGGRHPRHHPLLPRPLPGCRCQMASAPSCWRRRPSAASSSTMHRSPAPRWAARARWARPPPWRRRASAPHLGGSNEQVENAAEIALEHHLGMTCDPVGGLVQVPCIERNAFGAVKAVTAASLALRGDGTHFVPLDTCVETMRQTGLDMSERYKETSTGGLAVNVVEC